MDQLPLTDETDSGHDPYQTACCDNVAFVMDMLEAMRFEVDLVGDIDSARFWEGIINVTAAFRLRSPSRHRVRPTAR
ncbi:MAG: hypothetical protein IT449_07330 [Phycisphaerales bacterium]|nr:hypothetical protein [Phycisphaerales bacterium]